MQTQVKEPEFNLRQNPKVRAPEASCRGFSKDRHCQARSFGKLSVGTKVCGEVSPTLDSQEPTKNEGVKKSCI